MKRCIYCPKYSTLNEFSECPECAQARRRKYITAHSDETPAAKTGKGFNMSTLTLSQSIGKLGTINQGGLTVDVTVLDAKQAYGCTRFLVSPVAGSGEVWVSAERVQIQSNEVKA